MGTTRGQPNNITTARSWRYGQTANDPGRSYNPQRCACEVFHEHTGLSQQCSRKPGKGPGNLYCGQHAKFFTEGP